MGFSTGKSLVFPTPVGVFPSRCRHPVRWRRLPHTRGGVSCGGTAMSDVQESSPHPWGCFQGHRPACHREVVFPTPVGVFPLCSIGRTLCRGLPHTRGGVSDAETQSAAPLRSSPHPWGCFLFCSRPHTRPSVFPTPVGVFPVCVASDSDRGSLPHTRGGVSVLADRPDLLRGSSPHPWGVSKTRSWASRAVRSSPHPWGCFWSYCSGCPCVPVFPTPVGVFLKAGNTLIDTRGLPHTRGGVSFYHSWEWLRLRSSPHPWGCFLGGAVWAGLALVFPTPVGVFHVEVRGRTEIGGLPHTRGGVSGRSRPITDGR